MKRYIPLFLGLAVLGFFIFGCETIVDPEPDADVSLSTGDLEETYLVSACLIDCIDPKDLDYFEKEDSKTMTWGNRRNPFTKTVDIIYYNTLTHFVLIVQSSRNIADVLVDDESIKNFKGTVSPNTWQEFTFALEEDWEAFDAWAFELKVTGFGPPAYFDVEYQLIGECIYYTLTLAVNPEDVGSVTGEDEYKECEEVELTATANDRYEFVNWTDGDGNEISPDANFTYTMPAYDITLTANFEETTFELSLTVNPVDAGTVTGQGEYSGGEEVALTATTTKEGWEFVNWTDEYDNIISDLSDFTYTMPAMDKTLTAKFEGEDVFICGVSTITDIDGNVYNTVLIGGQCWMAENLRVTRYRNGGAIPTKRTDIQWNSSIYNGTGFYAIYPHGDVDGINSEAGVVAAYGKLYNWYAVTDSRGLCPEGWHVPHDDEWTTLVNYLGGSSVAGGKMKSTRTEPDPHPRWRSPNTGTTNESGFSGLPGGARASAGYYSAIGVNGGWWSSTEGPSSNAWSRTLFYNYGSVARGGGGKQSGFSVRCLRDY